MLVQQVTENVIAQLDFARIVDQIPIEDIVGNMDIEAIVRRVDLAGVIRESTLSLTDEAVDALREQGMALDTFAGRVVDRLLFRKRPRTLELRLGEDRAQRAPPFRACAPASSRGGRRGHRRVDRVRAAPARLGGYAVVNYLFTDGPLEYPDPGVVWNSVTFSVLLVAVLTLAWSGSGRTLGNAAVGLRVLTDRGTDPPGGVRYSGR